MNMNQRNGQERKRHPLWTTERYYCSGEDRGSVASLSLFAMHRATMDVWLRAPEALNGGGNLFQKVYGKSIFQYTKEDTQLNKYFNNAMADLSAVQTRKILEAYHGFDGVTTLVDVGGRMGATLHAIKGINFDLPQGNCHNWSDEACIKFLKNCYDSLPPKGKVVVIDFIMPKEPDESNASKYVAMLDNAMLIQPVGKERTEKQFQDLCKGAGFSGFRVAAHAVSALGVIEFLK